MIRLSYQSYPTLSPTTQPQQNVHYLSVVLDKKGQQGSGRDDGENPVAQATRYSAAS